MSEARLREELCAYGRSIFDRGLTHGSTGTLSVRLPDGFLMTPTGSSLGALGIRALRIGPQIDPGVPWTQSLDSPLALALKSGNFGSVDFFAKALAQLE